MIPRVWDRTDELLSCARTIRRRAAAQKSSGGGGASSSGASVVAGGKENQRRRRMKRRQRSAFIEACSRVQTGLERAADQLQELSRFTNSNSLLEDRNAQIASLTSRIKQDLATVSQSLEKVQREASNSGRFNRHTRAHTALIVDSLQATCAQHTKMFQQTLQARSALLKNQQSRRAQFSSSFAPRRVQLHAPLFQQPQLPSFAQPHAAGAGVTPAGATGSSANGHAGSAVHNSSRAGTGKPNVGFAAPRPGSSAAYAMPAIKPPPSGATAGHYSKPPPTSSLSSSSSGVAFYDPHSSALTSSSSSSSSSATTAAGGSPAGTGPPGPGGLRRRAAPTGATPALRAGGAGYAPVSASNWNDQGVSSYQHQFGDGGNTGGGGHGGGHGAQNMARVNRTSRTNEVSQVESTIAELGVMFSRMATMISEQG